MNGKRPVILQAVGNSKYPLYCLVISSFVNVGLDILFVGVFRWVR